MASCSFPMARVRQLMRAEDVTIRAANDAVFLINKASVWLWPPLPHFLVSTLNAMVYATPIAIR
jgi:hypothetical protein